MISDATLPACPPGYFADSLAQTAGRIHRAYRDLLDSTLAATLQTRVSGILLPVEQSNPGNFLEEQESAGCLLALDLSPFDGCAILSFSKEILFRVLNILTANPVGAEFNSDAGVTEVELHILREFFDLFTHALRKIWEPVYPFSFGILAMDREKIRQSVSAWNEQTAIVLKSRIQFGGIQFGDGDAGVALALPGFLIRLADVKSREATAGDRGANEIQESLLAALGEAMLRVDAVLHGSGVRIGELLRMKPGQILSLGTPPDAAFDCLINGKSRFKGEMIANGGRQAFRIETQTGPN